MNNINLKEKPSWLELPESEKLSHTYWVCYGTSINLETTPRESRCFIIFHSKEETEADACCKCENWIWDKKPAQPTTLKETMFDARSKGLLGVKVKGYVDGKWAILKFYPADVPLPLSELDNEI